VSIPLASSLLFILKKEFSLRHPTEDKVVANGRGYIVEPEKKLIDTRWRVPWRPKNIIYISLSYFLSFFLWIGKIVESKGNISPTKKKEMRYLIAFFFLSVWGIEKMLFSGTGTGGLVSHLYRCRSNGRLHSLRTLLTFPSLIKGKSRQKKGHQIKEGFINQ
jgi:hypothetical protein